MPVSVSRVFRSVLFAGIALGAVVFLPGTVAAQSSDVVYTGGQLTTPPKVASMQKAARLIRESYPENLRSRGVGGTVQLQLVVREDGKVDPSSVKVVNASVDALGEAAKSMATQLEFEPGKLNDKAVKSLVLLPIVYRAS